MKIWITKYALTTGIQEVDDAEISSASPSMISVPSLGVFATFHGEGREWHRTEDAAVERADLMRYKKIAALDKQIKKLEAIRF